MRNYTRSHPRNFYEWWSGFRFEGRKGQPCAWEVLMDGTWLGDEIEDEDKFEIGDLYIENGEVYMEIIDTTDGGITIKNFREHLNTPENE